MNTSTQMSMIAAPRSDTLPLALSALTGIMSAAVSGAGVYLTGADSIPQLTAAAIPGVAAFVVSYLMAQGMTEFGEEPFLPYGKLAPALPPSGTEDVIGLSVPQKLA